MLKRTLALLACALVSFSAGYFLRPNETVAVIEPQPIVQSYQIDDTSLIKEYLEKSLVGDWQNVLPLLSGEALVNAQHNLGRNAYVYQSRLHAYEVSNVATTGDYVIADTKVTTVTFTEEGDAHDLKFYRFYIYADSIFKVEQLPPEYENGHYQGNGEGHVVADYLSLVEQGEWQKALKLLSGSAKESGSKMAESPAGLSVVFTDLSIQTIGQGNSTAYIEATYKANDVPIQAFFILNNINGNWLIERILIVE